MGKSKLVVNILLPHHLAILKLFPYVSLVFQVFFGSCYCCFFFFPPFLPKFNYQVLSAQKKTNYTKSGDEAHRKQQGFYTIGTLQQMLYS